MTERTLLVSRRRMAQSRGRRIPNSDGRNTEVISERSLKIPVEDFLFEGKDPPLRSQRVVDRRPLLRYLVARLDLGSF